MEHDLGRQTNQENPITSTKAQVLIQTLLRQSLELPGFGSLYKARFIHLNS